VRYGPSEFGNEGDVMHLEFEPQPKKSKWKLWN
jgi:hypothetical protein